jgi:hypothetical protein
LAVNPGKYTVSIAVFAALACFAARDAGRDSLTGMGMGWLAAEDPATRLAQLCSESLTGQPASLVFERIQPGDPDAELPELLAANAREVVNFEWNAATGELSYRTTTATKIFSDLERSSSRGASPVGLSCGSR